MDTDKKKGVNFIQKLCLFMSIILVTGMILGAASNLLRRKDSERKYVDFIENADKVDVIFLGSSHMLNAISPAQLYRETGITSYNMAKPGGIIPEAYWTYRLARQYTKPKCVVIDLWSLDRDYHYVDIMNGPEDKDFADNSISLLHTNMDVWPLSKTKAEAINELISSLDVRAQFYLDFSLYHGRWNNLFKDDFIKDAGFKNSDYLLGAEANRYMLTNYNAFEPEDKSGNFEKETQSLKYLMRLIEECQEENIDVILTFMPMGGSYYEDFQAVNCAKLLEKKYGVKFVDMLDHSYGIVDIDCDMSDESHVNEFGMSKITTYFGKILEESEDLPDHRDQEGYELYENAAKYLEKVRYNEFEDEKDLYMTLGYLNMIDCNFALLVRGGAAALKDDIVADQLKQISGTELPQAARNADGPYFLLRQKFNDEDESVIFERAGESQDSGIRTLRGDGEYIGFNNFAAFYFDGNYDDNLFDMEERYYCDIQIFVFDDEGEVVCRKYFGRQFTEAED